MFREAHCPRPDAAEYLQGTKTYFHPGVHMKSAKTVLFAASLALAAGAAFAADHAPLRSDEPGFNNLDKNKDGSISRAEAAADKELSKHFSTADKDHDGKISRSEYLLHKGKEDVGTA